MLYLGDKKATLFKGDRRPVSLYLGDKKVTGYEYAEQTGEHLTFEKTYNDSAFVRINGKTVEIGEGEKSPDNPYELKSVGDDGGFDLVSSGKNLFDFSRFPTSYNFDGVSIIRENDIITIDGTKGTAANVIVYSSFFELKQGTYNLSLDLLSGTFDDSVRVYLYQIGYINGIVLLNGTTVNKAINISSDGQYRLAIYGAKGSSYNNCRIRIQLEHGSSATPYTPFRGMQTVHIPYTLRSLPDGTRDYIEINHKDKTAKLVQTVGVKSFNGSDTFSPYNTYTNTISRSIVISNAKGSSYNNDETHSNSLVRIQSVTSDIEGYGNGDPTNRLYIRLNKSRLTGYEESWTSPQISSAVNAFFEAKNWIFYYKLATPQVTDLDYEAVLTYYPQTQVFTNATVQPTLEAKIRTWEE